MLDRRSLLAGALAVISVPARADGAALQKAMLAFTGGAMPDAGKVTLDVAPLVENGNAVSVRVVVDHPMTPADHVTQIALFTELNPLPDVAIFRLTPRSGRAEVSARIRLATTQRVTAVARLSDGRCFSDTREVIVTIAACTEGE